jgi:hypothetical protein
VSNIQGKTTHLGKKPMNKQAFRLKEMEKDEKDKARKGVLVEGGDQCIP